MWKATDHKQEVRQVEVAESMQTDYKEEVRQVEIVVSVQTDLPAGGEIGGDSSLHVVMWVDPLTGSTLHKHCYTRHLLQDHRTWG